MSTGMPASIWLNKFGLIVRDYFGHTPYQVGSSLKTKDWRDVDVRLLLPDDEFEALFGSVQGYVNPKLAAITLAFSALGTEMTGLPIDFQIQTLSHANDTYGGGWRSALTEVTTRSRRDRPGDRDPSPDVVARLVASAPDLRPEMMLRLTNVARCLRAALADERVGEVGQAWFRTALAKIEGADEKVTEMSPGDRDQQQAAVLLGGKPWDRDPAKVAAIAAALAAAREQARAEEAARWQAKIEALAIRYETHVGGWQAGVAATLRAAVLDGER